MWLVVLECFGVFWGVTEGLLGFLVSTKLVFFVGSLVECVK